MENSRVIKGKQFLEHVWWSLAKHILRVAREHYKWDDDTLKEFTDIFLRPADYRVIVKQ
jgi:hypothetical protein